jgi:hypothetical protein
MRLTRLLFSALFGLLAAVALHAQSSTTATILRPYITSISPESLLTGADSTVLTIKGKRFQRGAEVFFNALKLTNTRLEGDSVLVIVIPARYTATPDIATLLLENPDQTKVGIRISILNPPPPQITLTYLSGICPSTEQNLTISGTNFSAGAVVRIGGVLSSIVSLSSTTIIVVIPNSVNIYFGPQLTVTNPDGQESRRLIILPIIDYIPAISKIDPPSIVLGSTKTLVITGINFQVQCRPDLTVRLGQITLSTVSVEPNRIIVRLPDSLRAGTYILSVTLFNGSVATQSISTLITGIKTEKENTTLYPNPATTALTLETTLDRVATLTLTLRNVMGAAVLEERHTAASGRFATTLDVSALASGVYVLEVSDGIGRWAQKVVKY